MGKYYKINNEIVIPEVLRAGKFLLCGSVIFCQLAWYFIARFHGAAVRH